MREPRSAGALGADFPYSSATVCYIEVAYDGTVTHGRENASLERARSGASRLYAVWPGQWSSDLFVIDDLDEYARAFGLVHDEKRTGLADHVHDVRITEPPAPDDRASYVSIRLRLECGCEIRDLDSFARQMRDQKKWDVATSTGWGSSWSEKEGHTYSLRVRRKSLNT